jgi:hypothetical protein
MHAPSKSTASLPGNSAGREVVASGLWPEFHRLSGICSRHSLDTTGFAEICRQNKIIFRSLPANPRGVGGNFFNGCYNLFSLPTNLFKGWMNSFSLPTNLFEGWTNSFSRPANLFRGWRNLFNGWTNSFRAWTILFNGWRNLFNHSSNSFSR